MIFEKSAGAVVFKKNGQKGEIEYLLLHYPPSKKSAKDYWDFPKGHVEKGEDDKQAALREVAEETGLKKVRIVAGFATKIRYFFQFRGEKISKTVVFFLAETKKKKINISSEHIGFQWLNYRRARRQLTFKNAKEVLAKVHRFSSNFR